MGLFGVYMLPLYGEGKYAFIRLQEAIMKISNDQSIFAWSKPPSNDDWDFEAQYNIQSMLSLSPTQFDRVVTKKWWENFSTLAPWALKNSRRGGMTML